MDTTKNDLSKPERPFNSRLARRTIGSILLVGLLVVIGSLIYANAKNSESRAAQSVTTQDCKKPGKDAGDLCSTVTREHGVVVTRTFETQKNSNGHRYSYPLSTSVQLNYGDTSTINTLCVAATVGSLTPDHPDFAREYAIVNKEYCDPAQKAKDAGDSDTCFMILNDAYGLAPLAFTMANIDHACAQPVQPKGKSALVDTGALRNDTEFYTDPSASPSKN